MSDLTLLKLKRTDFTNLYKKALLAASLSEEEMQILLQVSIILLNSENEDLKSLGYRVLILYTLQSNDPKPLFDVALHLGYFPIVKLIEQENEATYDSNSFFKEFQSSMLEAFHDKGRYFTFQQDQLRANFFENSETKSNVVVAPTSYGKTEMITSVISRIGNKVILVPTKALLAQTKKRILTSDAYNSSRKLITHQEMYNEGDANIIAVLTQERLVRLLQERPSLTFDTAFIDEAHNLLEDSDRSRLLALSILLLTHRNPSIKLQYLTPFLLNFENLQVIYTNLNLNEQKISEQLKSEKIFLSDFRNGGASLELYDQFLNEFIEMETETYSNESDLIVKKSGTKNIIYINRPSDIEKFVQQLCNSLPTLRDSEIDSACGSIEDYLHKDYRMLNCLRKGVVYHHGSVPDSIRLFVENLFSKTKSIKYIVTTSTLLEGVNIPAEKLFLLSNKKGMRNLTPSQLKNLIGRVCRFSEVFDKQAGSLKMLNPEIYALWSKSIKSSSNLRAYLKNSLKINKSIKEEPENILLKKTELNEDKRNEKKTYDEFLENIQPQITDNQNVRYAVTNFGKSCFARNITEIDILDIESTAQRLIDQLLSKGTKTADVGELLEMVNDLFIQFIPENDKFRNIRRLEDLGTRNFYRMILKWREANTAFQKMIMSFLLYWKELENTEDDPYAYVGKWGDKNMEGGFRTNWVRLSEKSEFQRVNLAIVRIKDEQDFVENNLFKFIEVINDNGLLNNQLYLKLKYGTDDLQKITMIRNGFGLSLANLLLDKYQTYLQIDIASNVVKLNASVLSQMELNDENQVLIYEASLNVI